MARRGAGVYTEGTKRRGRGVASGGVAGRAVAAAEGIVTIGCTRGGLGVTRAGAHVGRPRDPGRSAPVSLIEPALLVR